MEIVKYVQDLNNQTRLLINRGNTPLEIFEQEKAQGLFRKTAHGDRRQYGSRKASAGSCGRAWGNGDSC